ncbi:MAG TPA: helix-turn-helix domain-containing protein [Pilimelia sp.]|nr:helix-turn-helix domain-containing protein [Pilimelia sp.]
MATSADVARVRFSRLVARVLSDVRERGWTDRDIATATGVGVSTFHRWKRGEFEQAPDVHKVRAFFGGLGLAVRPALLALGIEDGRDDPEPEPPMDPDVRTILRTLADPSVPDDRKAAIKGMLRLIAREARGARREAGA